MALSDVLRPIRRRWYILLIGLLLAAGVGWAVAVLAPSQYTARGLVMLLPSALTTGPKGNPLLSMGGLELPARILTAYYASEPAQSDLEKRAPRATVNVSIEESTRGPIIAVDVKDATPDGAMEVLHYVTESIPENLARIQSEVGTPKRAAIGSMPLVLDLEAERDSSIVVRLVVASVVAMLALTLFVLFLVDGILLRGADSSSGDDTVGDDVAQRSPRVPSISPSNRHEDMSSDDASELAVSKGSPERMLPQDAASGDGDARVTPPLPDAGGRERKDHVVSDSPTDVIEERSPAGTSVADETDAARALA